MTIVFSSVAEDRPQRDGRRWVRLAYTDQHGEVHSFIILVPQSFDATAALTARSAAVDQGLTEREINRNLSEVLALGSEATPILRYSTAAENFLALRGEYQKATRVQSIMAGDFLSARTDTQLRAAFSMTQAQVTNLRANKLTPAANAAAAIRASSGA